MSQPESSALFVSYSSGLGGSERILADVATGLDEPVAAACPEGPLAERLRAGGVRVFPLRRRSMEMRRSFRDRLATPFRLGAQTREVRAVLNQLRPDLVLGWGTRGLIVASAALARWRSGRPALVFQQTELLPGPLIARLTRRLAGRADLVIALSAAIARDLDPLGRLAGRLHVVHPGVDPARFKPSFRREGPPEALVLGALVRWKRPDLALEAAALAAPRLPDLRLRFVGGAIDADGRERLVPALRRRAELPDLAGRVDLAGPLDDPRPALSRASCLVHCADCEPYGMVLVEALAAGLPVVAPAACGPTEIVDESCARLFPPGDPARAADALTDVLQDPARAERMGRAARALAERRHDIRRSLERYRELLAEVRAGRTGSSAAACRRR